MEIGLDALIDNIRAKYLARIYVGYINFSISWDEFYEFSEIIDKLLISDFANLQRSYAKKDFMKMMLLMTVIKDFRVMVY